MQTTKQQPKRPEIPQWGVRLAMPDDMAFVYDSWLKSSHKTYPNQYDVDYFVEARARVQRIVQESIIVVAEVAGVSAPDNLLGWLVFGKWRKALAVHYAYVKPDARRVGVFRSLVAFPNFEKWPVVLTAPAQDERVMAGLMKHALFDQRVLPLMQRGAR